MADDECAAEGVYRDGRYLVVDLHSSRLPFRCVKTNRRVEYYSSHEIRSRQNAGIAYSLWFGVCIYVRWVLQTNYGVHGLYVSVVFLLLTFWFVTILIRRSQILWIGLDAQFAERRKHAARIGWRLTLGGLIGLILVGVAEVAAAVCGLVSSPNAFVNFIPLGLALLAFSGFPFLIFARFPILRRRKRKEPFIWLAGAHRDFLASLPAWEPGTAARSTSVDTQDSASVDQGEELRW